MPQHPGQQHKNLPGTDLLVAFLWGVRDWWVWPSAGQPGDVAQLAEQPGAGSSVD